MHSYALCFASVTELANWGRWRGGGCLFFCNFCTGGENKEGEGGAQHTLNAGAYVVLIEDKPVPSAGLSVTPAVGRTEAVQLLEMGAPGIMKWKYSEVLE